MLVRLQYLRRVLLALACLGFSLNPLSVLAQQSASVGVGDTILNVSGQTSPNAFVSIYKETNLMGTFTAGTDGTFSQIFPAQSPGITRLSVTARDAADRLSDAASLEVNLQQHLQTSVYFFVPTTLEITSSSLQDASPLQLSGQTIPEGSVTLYVDGQAQGSTTADNDGIWHYSRNIQDLAAGLHGVFARVTDNFGAQSFPTRTQSFIITRPQPVPSPAQPARALPVLNRLPAVPRIFSPTTNQVFHQSRIVISGQGSAWSQIEVREDGQTIGAVWADTNGMWSLPYTFQPGTYSVQARACIDSGCSDFSSLISFSYQPRSSTHAESIKAYLEKSSISLTTTNIENKDGPETILHLKIPEGLPPFQLFVDWGDGRTDTSASGKRDIVLRHTYEKTGRYSGRILIKNALGSQELFFAVSIRDVGGKTFSFLYGLAGIGLLLAILITAWWYRFAKNRKR